ncbi:DUF1499 domain-containing protein [Phaeobacter gallaeciensis]|uniref:DUF1499 domain-containing protein n=1 Tax=Phaeobacter gallaeciensis TaxID=60890 RepID=UPI00237FC271|nr:DUF1499 domain-containing protein [Phaeobacter gallaeciensis]MDE4139984.1 DUF1499 domain-containing protein [Phaeobacter gallaeciensis]MDE4148406.1 DUF1499 domain-containing protein [Phaeobacter gallaeciensis]MDE4152650.1 DUF1499 domain-containing protein [Phaeobacter gallaeciensis]MDE4228016.1 DUF1499 domain-containing protein [Phaeobacter gallaeciensis]MDE4257115.1 DUF1499 domain-containing protein [Phaeobacter gallaeciensis]
MLEFMMRRIGFSAILLGLVSYALLALSVRGYRVGGWPWPQAYDLAGWGVWTALAGVIAALAALVVAFRKGHGAIIALLGLILALPVAGLGAAFEIAARTTPPINDISTDTEDPPVFWFTVTPTDYPAQNVEPQRSAYPDVRPLDLRVAVEDAFAKALVLVETRGWEVLSADPAENQIEAIARSRVFGFEDEVAVRVTEIETGTRIDMRSRSRLGQIDRGANARRIKAFLADLQSHVTE